MNQIAIKAIERILSKGDRAEVIPGPAGTVKVPVSYTHLTLPTTSRV